ncbi:MAG: hypothetical protein CMJ75_14485 [Planctomycetaceae bacterium]|nr:hypothetical protein [Planctomycetaceae bacterium]
MNAPGLVGTPLPVKRAKVFAGLDCLLITAGFLLLLAVNTTHAIVVLKVGEAGRVDPFTHLNGRQIARNSSGVWFLVYRGEGPRGATLFLAVSKGATPEFSGDFHPAIPLVADANGGVLPAGGGAVANAGIVIDDRDTLHLVWESDDERRVWYGACPVGGREPLKHIRQTGNWTGIVGHAAPHILSGPNQDSRFGDMAWGPHGNVWILWSEEVTVGPGATYTIDLKHRLRQVPLGRTGHELWMARVTAADCTRKRLSLPGPARRAVMDLDAAGSLHLVFAGRHLYYLRHADFPARFDQAAELTKTHPFPLWQGTSYTNYSVVGWGERALVVFERIGNIPLYGYFDGTNWQFESLNPTAEVYRNPILCKDQRGSAQVFWANISRGHTFYARWLGTRFSAPYSARTVIDGLEANDQASDTGPTLSRFHTVQRQTRPGNPIGMALVGNSPTKPVYFDHLIESDFKVAPGRKVLFLDMAEIQSMEGLIESFHPMKKHPGNPLLRTGPVGSWDSQRAHAYGDVIFDGRKFQMWYSGWSRPDSPLLPGTAGHHVGYAESHDGIHWVKPPLGQFAVNGSKANNIVDLGEGKGHAYMPMVVRDTRESDPARRYKMIVEQTGRNTLHFSPDGIHWSDGIVVRQHRWSDQRSFFYDTLETDPHKRWKVYSHGRARPPIGLRKICRDWSEDLIHWTSDPRNPVAHPRASTAAEYHLISVWIDAGMYLGLVDCWQRTQVQPQYLMGSRDGVNFFHVFDGQAAIELGAPGSWDAAWVAPVNVPLMRGDEMWVYYSGGPVTIGGQVDRWNDVRMQTGLATIRRDGFVSLDVAEGRANGSFTTIPWQHTGGELSLELNADGLNPMGGGRIRVELLSGDRVLATSLMIATSGVRIPVTWPAGRRLPWRPGFLRLRFHLAGSAQLYSFTFQAAGR